MNVFLLHGARPLYMIIVKCLFFLRMLRSPEYSESFLLPPRYQYKIKTLKCEKKKLEYSFGENADGWHAENPNFSLLERHASREQLDDNN